MKHCMECGTALEQKYLKNEGMIPWCPVCGEYRFPVFNTAVSMIVIHRETKKILLIKQYNRDFYILVAGYINRGENAETAAVREVMEETGLKVVDYQFNRTRFFEPSNTLMVNLTVFVEDNKVTKTEEVDSYSWFTFEEARENIRKNSLAEEFLVAYLDSLE